MKKTTTMMLCLAACFAAADTKITWLADVTADRAETVTGAQSNAIAAAAAHTNRTDNPHSVTAVQIGAITAELDPVANAALAVHTNRIDNPHGVTAVQIGALTAEQDLAALRTHHYGSPDIVESPAGWFVFNGAGTITEFNREVGGENVVIPWEIGGVPVTTIGADAFLSVGIVVSVIAPQTVTVIGNDAFNSCNSLASVTLPQAQTIGGFAFYGCGSLASVRMGQNAPAEATSVFAGITTPPNVYVTDPQATGWAATWNGAPVVRPPLYGSNVTAQAYTLNGDTITEWPSGGGETSIIAPLYESGTNVTVTSTQSVYSVAVTGAGPVGIDWSGLALDGTGRAEVTLRLNVTEWGGTNVTFSPALTFDQQPEILVTGVWEFAASTIDGTTTRVKQTWPECCGWQMADYGTASGPGAAASYGGGALPCIGTASNNTIRFRIPHELVFVRATIYPNMAPQTADPVTLNLSATVFTNGLPVTYNHSRSFQQYTYYYPRYEFWCVSWNGSYRSNDGPRIIYTRLYSGQDSAGLYPQFFVETRRLDANERAAYLAGWRP